MRRLLYILPPLFLILIGCSSPQEPEYSGPRFIGSGAPRTGLASTFSMSETRTNTWVEGASKQSGADHSNRSRPRQENISDSLRSVYEATQLGETRITVQAEE